MSVSLNNLSTAISTLQSDIATINNNNTSLPEVYGYGNNLKSHFRATGYILSDLHNGPHFISTIPSDNNIIQVCSGDHTLFLDSAGKVYSCGLNQNGATGLNTNTGLTLEPTEITSGDIVGKTIINIDTGKNHSIFLDSEGKVYSCGYNFNGVTGHGISNYNNISVPTEITSGHIVGKPIIQVSASLNHTLFLDSAGKVYVCGANSYGATGLGLGAGATLVATEITSGDIVGKPIIQVSAGGGHSLFLDSAGKVYSCGNNVYGRTGLNTISGSSIPTEIAFGDIVGKTITQVATGYYHSLFIDSTGKAYSCGMNAVGTALPSYLGNTLVPTRIIYFRSYHKNITYISANYDNSFFIAS